MISLVPPLYYRHRGHFLVAASIGVLHLFAVADEITPYVAYRHSQPGWRIHNALMSSDGWATLHAAAAIGLIVGIYYLANNLLVLRIVAAFSASIFFLLGIGFAFVSNYQDIAMLRIGFCLFVVLSSTAAVLEPGRFPDPREKGRHV